MIRRGLLFVAAVLTSATAGCQSVEDGDVTGAAGGVEYSGVRILATIQRPNMGVVRFLASEQEQGVGCDELVPADGEALPASSDADARDCLGIFLDLTAGDVPVPAALVVSSTADDPVALVAHRPLVDELPQSIPSIEPARTPSLKPMSGDQETSPHSCAGSAGNQAHFIAEHCDWSGGSDVISYCDSGAWWSLTRTTAGARRRNSFEEMLCCTALADVVHEYWNGTSWPNVYTITNIPDNYYHWSRWQGAAKWERRVRIYRIFPEGFFRSHTLFYN